MPLGMEVGLGTGDFVFYGDAANPRKKAHPSNPTFGSCLLWPNGWMDEDATWYGSRPRPRPYCIRRGPSSPRKGHSSPLFSAHVYCGYQLLLSSCNKNFIAYWLISLKSPRVAKESAQIRLMAATQSYNNDRLRLM